MKSGIVVNANIDLLHFKIYCREICFNIYIGFFFFLTLCNLSLYMDATHD